MSTNEKAAAPEAGEEQPAVEHFDFPETERAAADAQPAHKRFSQSLAQYVDGRLRLGRAFYRRKIADLELPCEGDILDVGCGPGQWAAVIAEDNPDATVVAADRNEFLLACARGLREDLDLPNMVAQPADVYELPFQDESFDTVLAVGLLQLVRVEDATSELVRVTRPGGRIFLNLAGKGFYVSNVLKALLGRDWKILRQNWKFLWNTWKKRENKPFTFFSPKRVDALAERHGLEVVYARAVEMYPPRPATFWGMPINLSTLLRKKEA